MKYIILLKISHFLSLQSHISSILSLPLTPSPSFSPSCKYLSLTMLFNLSLMLYPFTFFLFTLLLSPQTKDSRVLSLAIWVKVVGLAILGFGSWGRMAFVVETGLSFDGRWLLAVVVIASCVGLMERERKRDGREKREVSCLYHLMV